MTSSNFGRSGYQPGNTPTMMRQLSGAGRAISLPAPTQIPASKILPLKAPAVSLPPGPNQYYEAQQAYARSGSPMRTLSRYNVRQSEQQLPTVGLFPMLAQALATPISHQTQAQAQPLPVVQTWRETAVNTAIRIAAPLGGAVSAGSAAPIIQKLAPSGSSAVVAKGVRIGVRPI